ncbi:MAG: adenylate cyclase [Solirubrobacteraceae bacterium]|jgi:class 3 adenylate cyclase|nr:adenylate cyclase [Solirubrobacteraceae bacterium]
MRNAHQHTFVFADIVGFTTFTAQHGDDAAADLATGFFDEVARLAAAHGAEAVKAIGDAAMVRASTASGAVGLALAVLDELSDRRGVPAVRIGMHTGPAVERAGDWFGTTVNVAARVAAAARAGEVLVTHDTWNAVRPLRDLELEHRGPYAFKNVAGELAVYAISEQRPESSAARAPGRRLHPAIDPLPAFAAASARP